MSKPSVLGWVLVVASVCAGVPPSIGDSPLVLKLSLGNEPITPATAGFIRRAIEQAESEQAECLVIVLDTPGGRRWRRMSCSCLKVDAGIVAPRH